jgi:hypothetical protein
MIPKRNAGDLESQGQMTRSASRRARCLESRDQIMRSKSRQANHLDGSVDDPQMQREKPKSVDWLLKKKLWKNRPFMQVHRE